MVAQRVTLDGTARISRWRMASPISSWALARASSDNRFRLAFYRRLNGVDPAARSLGFGKLRQRAVPGPRRRGLLPLAGRGPRVRPAGSNTQLFALRLFAEHQFAAPARTDLSFPHLVHSSHVSGRGSRCRRPTKWDGAGLKGARTRGGQGCAPGARRVARCGRRPVRVRAHAPRRPAPARRWARNCSRHRGGSRHERRPGAGAESLRIWGDPPHCAATAARRRWAVVLAQPAELANRMPQRGSPCSRMWTWAGPRKRLRDQRPLVAAGVARASSTV